MRSDLSHDGRRAPIPAVTTSAPSSLPEHERLAPRPYERAIFVTEGHARPRVLKVIAAIGALAALAWLLALVRDFSRS